MTTTPSFIALEELRVANPCRADWNKMQGDERTRFCNTCAKNVYNLSGMTRPEAEALVREAEGEICIRFYRRADGTVLTGDCPVGISATPVKPRVSAAMLTMLLAPLLAVGGAVSAQQLKADVVMDRMRQTPVVGSIVDWLSPQPMVVMGEMVAPPVMGKIAAPGNTPVCTPTPQNNEGS